MRPKKRLFHELPNTEVVKNPGLLDSQTRHSSVTLLLTNLKTTFEFCSKGKSTKQHIFDVNRLIQPVSISCHGVLMEHEVFQDIRIILRILHCISMNTKVISSVHQKIITIILVIEKLLFHKNTIFFKTYFLIYYEYLFFKKDSKAFFIILQTDLSIYIIHYTVCTEQQLLQNSIK